MLTLTPNSRVRICRDNLVMAVSTVWQGIGVLGTAYVPVSAWASSLSEMQPVQYGRKMSSGI